MPRFRKSSTRFGSAPRWLIAGLAGLFVHLESFRLVMMDMNFDTVTGMTRRGMSCRIHMIHRVTENIQLLEIFSKSAWLLRLSDTATHIISDENF